MSDPKHHEEERWHFDNYARGPSYVSVGEVDVEDCENEWRIAVNVKCETKLSIDLYRDHWGTYITFRMGAEEFTIAQQDGTRSFFGALFAAIERDRKWIDVKTKPPTHEKGGPTHEPT